MRLIFLITLALSALLFIATVELSRRDLLDRNSFFIALSLSVGLAFISVMPDFLRAISEALGFQYTYVFSSTIGILGLLALNIYTLSKLSKLERRLSNLSQDIALEDS